MTVSAVQFVLLLKKHYSVYSCSHCHGQGSTICGTCRGKQQLLVYISLTVKWCFFNIVYLPIVSLKDMKAINMHRYFILIIGVQQL